MLRSGVTEQGKRSVTSHTGSLTTSRQIWNAVYAQTNIIPVRSLEELIETIQAFYYCKDILPKVNGVILITWSGGTATVATDLISEIGVDVPRIQDPAMSKMKQMIRIGSTLNPLDLPWVSGSETYNKIIKIAADEPYIGGIFLETFAPSDEWNRGDDYLIRLLELKNYCTKLGKPFFISLPYGGNALNREEFKNKILGMGIPIFPSFDRAARAFLNLYKYQQKMKQRN